MADDQDRKYVNDAEKALDGLYDRYAEADDAGKWMLKPAIQKAVEELSNARLSLFKEGTLVMQADIDALTALKKEIDGAADAQSAVLAAIKLAALLGAFA
jgi:hypothetical protein